MTDYLEIPDFLKISLEDRRKAWEGKKLTDPHATPTSNHLEELRRADLEAKRKAKNARGLKKLKANHEGEYYDRRKKQWLPRKAK